MDGWRVASNRDVARRWLLILLLAMTGAACGTGGATGAVPTPSPVDTVVPTTSPPSPVEPTDLPLPAEPPRAMLSGSWDAPAAGVLGTFSWDGLVSDAPWIVGHPIGDASIGPMTVMFDPGIGQATWTARWAPVIDGEATDALTGDDGATGAIVISPPGTPGDWSLQLTATFAVGYDATWYWRLDTVR